MSVGRSSAPQYWGVIVHPSFGHLAPGVGLLNCWISPHLGHLYVYIVPNAMHRPVSRKKPASATKSGRWVFVFMEVAGLRVRENSIR